MTPAWRNSIWHVSGISSTSQKMSLFTDFHFKLAMHEAWNFNTTTAQKVVAYKNITKIVKSMRDISPDSGSYLVSVISMTQYSGGPILKLHRMRAIFMNPTIHVRTIS